MKKGDVVLPLCDDSEGAAAAIELVSSTEGKEFECEECDALFSSESDLATHFTSDHESRGNKRHRKNTSLLSDPGRPCALCDETNHKMRMLQEENVRNKRELQEAKAALESKLKELNVKASEIQEINSQIKKLNTEFNQSENAKVNN